MPYLIETFDKPNTQAIRQKYRPAHLRFLEEKKQKLLACGAKLQDNGTDAGGGIYIVDVETREEAKAFINADPFHQVNLFEKIIITRWRKAYLDGKCFI